MRNERSAVRSGVAGILLSSVIAPTVCLPAETMADIQDPSNFGGPRPAPGPSPPHERHDSIRDVEKGPEVAACPANNNEEGTDEPSDPGPIHNPDDAHLVFWDSADDPANPYNWPQWRKTLDCTLISLLTFITPLSASMLAPALPQLMRDFGFNITTDTYNNNNNSNYNNTSTTTVATAVAAVARAVTGGDGGSSSGGGGSSGSSLAPLVVSGYFLGFVAGPLSLAPLSERFGRRPVYTACSAGFVALHAASGAAPSLGALLALRFLAGVFGACPLVVGGGTIADVVPRARRGPVMAAFSMGPLLGPVVGPIAGTLLPTPGRVRRPFFFFFFLISKLLPWTGEEEQLARENEPGGLSVLEGC